MSGISMRRGNMRLGFMSRSIVINLTMVPLLRVVLVALLEGWRAWDWVVGLMRVRLLLSSLRRLLWKRLSYV